MAHPLKRPRHLALPPVEPVPDGDAEGLGRPHDLLGGERKSKGKPAVSSMAAPAAARDRRCARFFHPRSTASSSRPARLRQVDAVREPSSEHDPGTSSSGRRELRAHLENRRCRSSAARWGSDLALRVRRDAPRPRHGARPARDLPAAQEGDRLVLPGRRVILSPTRGEPYLAHIPERARRPREGVHKRLTSDDPAVRLAAAKIWSGWRAHVEAPATLPSRGTTRRTSFALAFARIEFTTSRTGASSRWTTSSCATPEKIPPHSGGDRAGRYDVVCPIFSAWALHRAWPEAGPSSSRPTPATSGLGAPNAGPRRPRRTSSPENLRPGPAAGNGSPPQTRI